MANTSTKVKGVAIGKRAKIDKAQSIMLGAVCGASLVLGITIVGVIYLGKTINYNGKLIEQESAAAKSYETVQTNLKAVADGVRALGANKNLESVALNTVNRKECLNFNVNESITPDNIENFRNCSALRVIPDTVPTSEKNISAALGSMTQLLMWSNNGAGVSFEGISESDATEIFTDTFHSIGIAVSVRDEASKVRGALDTVESSIRNFDLQVASIRFGNSGEEGQEQIPTIEFTGTYSTYYSDKVNVEVVKHILCADTKNEKCPGDTLTVMGN
jgi:hypothetical protein